MNALTAVRIADIEFQHAASLIEEYAHQFGKFANKSRTS
jgi:hypothetical protein